MYMYKVGLFRPIPNIFFLRFLQKNVSDKSRMVSRGTYFGHVVFLLDGGAKRYESHFHYFKWNYMIFLHSMIPLIILHMKIGIKIQI